jgi:GT2 family glycosyltransferase
MTRTDMPSVTVVLLSYQTEGIADTAACIESLQSGCYPDLRIIVIDNGTPQDVAASLENRFPDVVYCRLPQNLGFTGGNNRGIERALDEGCDYVLMLNNDTVVEPDCVTQLVQAAEADRNAGAVGGQIFYFDEPKRIWFAGGDFSRMRGTGLHRTVGGRQRPVAATGTEEVSFLTGCCMLVPADVLRKVGGLEEDFFAYIEDVEFCLRLRTAGYKVLYAPAARLFHKVPVVEPEIPPHKIDLRDRNRRRLARRRFTAVDQLRFALFFYPSRLLQAGRYLLRGDRARLMAVWYGVRSE